MKCPFCSGTQTSVIDKRQVKSSDEIRRRRVCLKCSERFTTYERIGDIEHFVIKRSGSRQIYDQNKLRFGIEKALEKRPALDQIDVIMARIEGILWGEGKKEVESDTIGKVVLAELKQVDSVAYLRFASVYRKFNNPEDFTKEVKQLQK